MSRKLEPIGPDDWFARCYPELVEQANKMRAEMNEASRWKPREVAQVIAVWAWYIARTAASVIIFYYIVETLKNNI